RGHGQGQGAAGGSPGEKLYDHWACGSPRGLLEGGIAAMSEFRAQVLERIARGEAVCGVIGLGYVGLPLVMEIAGAGYRVLGFDVSRSVTDGLNAGKSHVQDVP